MRYKSTILYHLIQFDRGVTCDRPDEIMNSTGQVVTCDPQKILTEIYFKRVNFFEIFCSFHWMVSSGGPVTWDMCDISTNREGLWPVTCRIELNGTVWSFWLIHFKTTGINRMRSYVTVVFTHPSKMMASHLHFVFMCQKIYYRWWKICR